MTLRIERTGRSVIYKGVVIFDTFKPFVVTAWANMGPDADGDDLRKYMVDQLAAEYPGTTPDQYRVVEFSWTEIDPVRILAREPVNLEKDQG